MGNTALAVASGPKGMQQERRRTERFATELFIGGQIKRSSLPELIQAINSAQVTKSFHSCEPIVLRNESDLFENLLGNWLFVCYADQKSGEFKEIEEVLFKYRIPFTRVHYPRASCNGQRAEYRGHNREVRFLDTDVDGRQIVYSDQVREILRYLNDPDPAKAIALSKRAIDTIAPDISPLPEFAIVGG
jgi:hypothetical protein